MHSKLQATGACDVSSSPEKKQKKSYLQGQTQRGVTLIELMVGIAIGLLVVAAAISALMVSRGISGTVSDASSIQQQASHAMRVLGLQLRQAGSLRLNLDPGTNVAEDNYLTPVAFETTVSNPDPYKSINPVTDTLKGTASPVTLTVGYRRYKEPTFTSTTEISQSRNCLGWPADTSTHQLLESVFSLDTVHNELKCSGNGEKAQPVAQNIANFQVRYLVQDKTSAPGIPTIQSVDAGGVNLKWGQVQAVEVCLVLYGNEAIGMPTDGTSTYTDCDGTTEVDMSTLTGKRARRMHVAFRNVFQLRSQGLIGSVL